MDVPFEVETDGVRSKYILIDTAGMRKTRQVDDSVEFFSVQRAEESIARSDITVLVIDAEAGVTEQDKKIADIIVEQRRACIIVINKWDLFDEEVRKAREEEIESRKQKKRTEGQAKTLTTLAEFGEWVQEKLFFLDYAPVIFTSAKSGFHLDRLLEAVRYVAAQLQQKIPTAILNRTIRDAVERRQPISDQGHRLKFFYATQVRQAPPTFLLFVNRDELFSDQYKKNLAGRTAHGVRLRRLSAGAGAEGAAENRRAETEIQACAGNIRRQNLVPIRAAPKRAHAPRSSARQQPGQGTAMKKLFTAGNKSVFCPVGLRNPLISFGNIVRVTFL